MLLVKNTLCSQLYCHNFSNLVPLSFKSRRAVSGVAICCLPANVVPVIHVMYSLHLARGFRGRYLARGFKGRDLVRGFKGDLARNSRGRSFTLRQLRLRRSVSALIQMKGQSGGVGGTYSRWLDRRGGCAGETPASARKRFIY